MNLNLETAPVSRFLLETAPTQRETRVLDTGVFDDIFNAAMAVFNDVNAHQLAADRAQLDFATGRTDDMLAVIMAEQRAYTALDFTVQVTSRAIEAYREIMRIQL